MLAVKKIHIIALTLLLAFCQSSAIVLAQSPLTSQPAPTSEKTTQPADSQSNPSETTKIPEPEAQDTSTASSRQMTPEQLQRYREAKASIHCNLAQIYFYAWNLNLADVEYEVALLYTPTLLAARRDLCLVSLFSGHPLKALAQVLVLFNLMEPVPLTEPQTAELNLRAGKLHYEQALTFARKGDWVNAVAECQWALSYQPTISTYRHSLAFAYANLGDYSRAEKEYTSAFNLDPTDGFARADFAYMLEGNGEKQRAIAELHKAVALEPHASALHVDLGWMAEARGDWTYAEQEFQKAVEYSPNHAALWLHLAKIFEKENKTKDAIDAYTKALSIDPSQSDIKDKLAKLKSAAKS